MIIDEFLAPLNDFRSLGDALAANFMPCLLPHLRDFYAGSGPMLAELFSRRVVDHLDRHVTARMKEALTALDAAVVSQMDSNTFDALLLAELGRDEGQRMVLPPEAQ